MGKALGQRGGLFDQARQNSMNTFGTAPKIGGGGGIFSWMKKKIGNDLNNQGTFKAPLPFGGSVSIPTPQPAPQPDPAPAPQQKSYRDFDWSDYNADRQTMDVDERDQYYDNYQRDRDFWGNYYNRQPSMPSPIQGPMRNPYEDQRMEQDRMYANRFRVPYQRAPEPEVTNMPVADPIDEGEYTYMPEDRSRFMQPRQGFFGRPIRREPSFGGFGGGLRSLLGGLLGNGLGGMMPRPRGGLSGLFGGFRPQPQPRPRGLSSLLRLF